MEVPDMGSYKKMRTSVFELYFSSVQFIKHVSLGISDHTCTSGICITGIEEEI